MHPYVTPSLRTFVAASAIVFLSACGWVDSTGVQATTVQPGGPNPVTVLANGQAISLLEEQSATATLKGEGANLKNWVWTARGGNAIAQCTGVNGFDSNLAKTNLSSACTNQSDCKIAFDELVNESDAQFNIRMPTLSSPVALNYELSAIRDDNMIVSRQQVLCGISINEAPLANDDNYQALRSEALVVNGDDVDNLLANDSDDIDLRNKELHILKTAVQAPLYATQFTLSADGGFLYQADENAPVPDNGQLEDTFVYAVSDGLHTVNATVVVKIIQSNQAPLRIKRIPDLEVATTKPNNSADHLELDLSEYFTDPDGDSLSYKLEPGQLPQSGSIILQPNGLLVADVSPEDVGSWRLSVVVSDGLDNVSDVFRINILDYDGAANNEAPTASDISNRTFRGNFSYDVSVFFDDSEGDVLTFSALGLPDGVSITSLGVISGFAADNNDGRWFVRVTAIDQYDESVSDGFMLILR